MCNGCKRSCYIQRETAKSMREREIERERVSNSRRVRATRMAILQGLRTFPLPSLPTYLNTSTTIIPNTTLPQSSFAPQRTHSLAFSRFTEPRYSMPIPVTCSDLLWIIPSFITFPVSEYGNLATASSTTNLSYQFCLVSSLRRWF